MWLFCAILFIVLDSAFADDQCQRLEVADYHVALVVTGDLDPPAMEILNIVNGRGYVQALAPRLGVGVCERVDIKVLKVSNETDIGIYDRNVTEALNDVAFVIGEEIEAVRSYASQKEHYKHYFITTPIGSNTEQLIEDRYMRRPDPTWIGWTYALWPSPTSVVNAVVGVTNLLTTDSISIFVSRKILMIVYAQRYDSLMYVDRLAARLRENKFDVLIYDLYGLTTRVSEVDKEGTTGTPYRQELIYGLTRDLREKLDTFRPHMVLFYADLSLELQIKALKSLFSKGAQLERDDVPWLIADIELMSQKMARSELMQLEVLKTRLLVIQPCLRHDRTTSEGFESCLQDDYPVGLVTAGLVAGKGFLRSLIQRPAADGYDLAVGLYRHFQMECANNETRPIALNETGRVQCPESESVHRVGFSRHDLFRTMQIRPRPLPSSGRVGMVVALYFNEESLNIAPTWLKEADGDFLEKRQIRLGEYIVIGQRPQETVERAVVIEDRPFVIKSADGSFTGMAIDIYNAVKMKLVEKGIVLKLTFIETDVYGSLNNGTWSGVFGSLNTEIGSEELGLSVKVVLGLGQISITEERADDKNFTFSPVFAHTAVTYMIKTLSVYDAYLQFFRPFNRDVWLALGFVVLATGFYYRLLDVWNPFRENIPEGQRFSWKESFWHAYLTVTQIGGEFGAVVTPARVYTVFYWFFALVVVGCYTGSLASFMTESRFLKTNIAELVHHKGYKFVMITNSSLSTAYLHAIFGNTISKSLLKPDRTELVPNYTEGVRKVKSEKLILMGTSLVMKDYQQNDDACSLSVNERPYSQRRIEALAFPMRADWHLADEFKNAMRSLKETGELQLIYHKWINSHSKCVSSTDPKSHSLDWNNFIGLYILVGLGAAIAFVFLAIKLVHLKLKDRRTVSESNGPEENGAGIESTSTETKL